MLAARRAGFLFRSTDNRGEARSPEGERLAPLGRALAPFMRSLRNVDYSVGFIKGGIRL
jgi:hypothetical protein